MDNFSYELLVSLIKKYHNSRLSKGGSERRLTIRLTTKDRELSTYVGKYAYRYIDSNDAELDKLQKKGYIFVNRDRNDQLLSVELNIESVPAIIKECKLDDRDAHLRSVVEILQNCQKNRFVADFVSAELDYVQKNYSWHKSYFSDENELVVILKVLNAMVMQDEEVMERDFSVKVLGDSKAFAVVKSKVISIAKKYDHELIVDEDDKDADVLMGYNIVKNSTYALVKGNLNFRLNDQIIDLEKLGFEYSLSDEMIKKLVLLPSTCTKLITVENLTSFYKLNIANSVVIFLSGFHNHTKQMLLKKIYAAFGNIEYLHFGDIDAGGFVIYNNLLKSTQIPFKPYQMGIEQLKTQFNYAKPLTEYDKKRLGELKKKVEYSVFAEVIDFMLENSIKLEQEALD